MPDPDPPINLVLERLNRLHRPVLDLAESQNGHARRNTQTQHRMEDALSRIEAGMGEIRREIAALAAEQASLAMRSDEALLRAAQVDRRLDDWEDRPVGNS